MTEQRYDFDQSQSILKNYVCAGCWRELQTRFLQDGTRDVIVYCPNCGDNRGLHSVAWVEQQRQVDLNNQMDVEPQLERLGIIQNPHKGKTADQLMKELGF